VAAGLEDRKGPFAVSWLRYLDTKPKKLKPKLDREIIKQKNEAVQ